MDSNVCKSQITTKATGNKIENQLESSGIEGLKEKSNPQELFFEKLKWMTAKEAAIYLRLSVGQIRNMVWRGQIKSYKLNNRLRFLKKDLEILMKSSQEWRQHD